jgi:hypothetical protein
MSEHFARVDVESAQTKGPWVGKRHVVVGHRASCSCGWKGASRRERRDALLDAARHATGHEVKPRPRRPGRYG